MTGKEKLITLLKEFGIGFTEKHAGSNRKPDGVLVLCEQGMAKVDGYNQFYTSFEFDATGKFIEMGAWE